MTGEEGGKILFPSWVLERPRSKGPGVACLPAEMRAAGICTCSSSKLINLLSRDSFYGHDKSIPETAFIVIASEARGPKALAPRSGVAAWAILGTGLRSPRHSPLRPLMAEANDQIVPTSVFNFKMCVAALPKP